MDILYILGSGSKHDNIELRMSLRSICKYGKNIGRVIVAGNPVDWLSDDVVKVKIEDKYKRKHHNIMNCVQTCVENGIVDGEFLLSSDDHFYIKPTDFDNYPIYVKCKELRNRAIRGERCYGYHVSLVQTRSLLAKYKMPIVNFEQHCNTHLHAKVIKDFKWLIDETYTLERGSPPTTIVLNAWLTTDFAPKKLITRADVKMPKANSVEEVYSRIGDRECFSIGDSIFSGRAIYDFFKKEFPTKCRYER